MNPPTQPHEPLPATLAVDAMGGDRGPQVTVPAVLAFLNSHPHASVRLFGDRAVLNPLLVGACADRLHVVHTEEQVTMDEAPVAALKHKRRSSMRLALEALKANQADVCVSAGNTGALMAIGRYVLKMIDAVERPAIMQFLPHMDGREVAVLDLGANVDNSPNQLHQFACMGSVAMSLQCQGRLPNVGLLNIGHEAIKGNAVVQATNVLLGEERSIRYLGYVEGNDMFTHPEVDVVVCDGFVGNAMLKASEGAVRLFTAFLKQHLTSCWSGRLAAMCLSLNKEALTTLLSADRYNGAMLLGLQRLVLKSHGGASVEGYRYALERAYRFAVSGINQRLLHVWDDQPHDLVDNS